MSTISFSPGSRTWLLSTPHSSYGLQLDATDAPCHLHWGAPLTLKQLQALPHTYPLGPGNSFGGRRIPEELAVDGGPRYGVPGLQVRFADGTRALEWAYAGARDQRGRGRRLARAAHARPALPARDHPELPRPPRRRRDRAKPDAGAHRLRGRRRARGRRHRGAAGGLGRMDVAGARRLPARPRGRRVVGGDAAAAGRSGLGRDGAHQPARHHRPQREPVGHARRGRRGRGPRPGVERGAGLERQLADHRATRHRQPGSL